MKTVHPDSGHADASAKKFTEVDNAFRILQSKFAKERRGIRVDEDDGVKEFDIKVRYSIRNKFKVFYLPNKF